MGLVSRALGRNVERRMMARPTGGVTRRELLKLSPLVALAAFAVPPWQERLLRAGLTLTDAASARLYRPGHLAPVFADREVVPFEQFPYNYWDVVEPPLDLDTWTLRVGGEVAHPGEYTLEQIRSLPKVTQNTRHVCVEGWDVVGRFGGARLSDFLTMIGAASGARYLTVTCADRYYESLDLETALQPQSLLCYEMYDQPLDRGHGAPLRLSLPTKLGYKHAKYLLTLDVTRVLPERRSLWGDEGYSWYGGL